MKFNKKCVEKITYKKIKCEENKRKIIFNNPKRITVKKIKVDNCQIMEGARCDFLVIYKNIENFIELKGEDIKYAFTQLIETIKILGENNCKKRNSFIISSRSPFTSAEIQHHKLIFKRKYKSTLIVKNGSWQVKIE